MELEALYEKFKTLPSAKIREELGCSRQTVWRLKKGQSANVDLEKLIRFINRNQSQET